MYGSILFVKLDPFLLSYLTMLRLYVSGKDLATLANEQS